jgi:hypothetical protein
VNGDVAFHASVPDDAACVKLFVELSAKNAPEFEFNNKDVPEIAVNGAVGGVKLAVYTAVPFTTRKLEI